MSQKVSQALIKLLNEITSIETTRSKVQAAIFVKESEKMIEEKIKYLYNLLHLEASHYNQNSDNFRDIVESIIKTYKDKLYIVYDELYLQYANIQNEIGDARLNQKVAMINFQKIINDSEINKKDYTRVKEKLKNKNELYDKIIKKCEEQFSICMTNFEDQINNAFFIENSLITVDENNIFSKIKHAIINLFKGKRLYKEALLSYQTKIDKIDVENIVNNFRNQTIEFVTDILEIKDINLEKAV